MLRDKNKTKTKLIIRSHLKEVSLFKYYINDIENYNFISIIKRYLNKSVSE